MPALVEALVDQIEARSATAGLLRLAVYAGQSRVEESPATVLFAGQARSYRDSFQGSKPPVTLRPTQT